MEVVKCRMSSGFDAALGYIWRPLGMEGRATIGVVFLIRFCHLRMCETVAQRKFCGVGINYND